MVLPKTYKLQQLHEGDVAEFPENSPNSTYGIVLGGFGMSIATIGSKIFGIFDSIVEGVVKEFNEKLKCAKNNKPYVSERQGYTHRQPCRLVGKIDLKTGEYTEVKEHDRAKI